MRVSVLIKNRQFDWKGKVLVTQLGQGNQNTLPLGVGLILDLLSFPDLCEIIASSFWSTDD